MNFLYPGFLFALFAVLIPVLIHLFNFRKFKKVYFSNVSFLKEIQEQNSYREKLKNLLVLISRILAITCLVLAFSRPFLSSSAAAEEIKTSVVSVYIDNSYSMGAMNREGSLLDEAIRRAKEIVGAHQLNDKFHLLTNDFEGKHQRLLNAEEFIRALDDIKISSANKNLQQVINRQQSIFKGNVNRLSYLLSDFQKGFSGERKIKKNEQIKVSLIQLNANELPNISVDSVWFLSPVHQRNSSQKIIIRIKNFGKEDAENIPLTLYVNNQQKAVSAINVVAGSSVVDTLSFIGAALGWQKGVVSIKDFPITFDDEFNFSFNVSASQQLLSIHGSKNTQYIRSLFAADQYFQLTEMSENNINYSAINRYSLIILNGVTNLTTGLAQALKDYASNGGSVVVFPNTESDLSTYTAFLTTLNLPAASALSTEPTKVAQIELKDRLFKDVFESLPKNVDLPQVSRYFNYIERNSASKENLLTLPAGKLYLSRFALGNGQIFLSATGLNDGDGNLAKHPIFVPLMYRIAFESVQNLPLFYVLAKDNAITLSSVKLERNQSLKMFGDGYEVIPEVSQQHGKTQLYIADQFQKPGFYEIKKLDSTLAIAAFNNDRLESNMSYESQSDLQNYFDGKDKVNFIDTKTENISSAIAEKNNGTELWKLCLILSLIFITAEIVLVRFFNTTTNTKIHEPLN